VKAIILTILLVASANVAVAQANENLGVFVGWSHLITQNEVNAHDVEPNGISGGLLVPVHLSKVPLFVKIKVIYHSANYESGYSDPYGSYIQVSNSFLAGIKSWRSGEYSAQVLLGAGIQNESIYSKWGEGVAAAEVFGEFSVIVAKHVGGHRLGVLASFEQGLNSKDIHLVTDRRFQLAIVSIF